MYYKNNPIYLFPRKKIKKIKKKKCLNSSYYIKQNEAKNLLGGEKMKDNKERDSICVVCGRIYTKCKDYKKSWCPPCDWEMNEEAEGRL
jgi:hypothetical protein